MCDKDCFNCIYKDCICEDITGAEIEIINDEDAAIKWDNMNRRQRALYKYENSPKGKERAERYNNSPKGKERAKKASQRYRAAHKQQQNEYSKKYYAENAEVIKARKLERIRQEEERKLKEKKEKKREYDRRRYLLKRGILEPANVPN